ncbi:hypothetical protein TNCV_3600001 [Trichonephila clavipes]|nr:hypothetical protein TNCV_3600001 [Trichonephila clavipes]
MSPSEQEEDERGSMPTSAIKDLLKKWEAVRAMVLEWHPSQADVSRYGKFKRELRSSLTPHREILKELQDRNRQVIATTLNNFYNDGEITVKEEFEQLRRKLRSAVISDESDDEN